MPKLTDHVYGVLTFGASVNGYIIENPQDDGRLTLVDFGAGDGFLKAIKAELAKMQKKKTLADVAYLIPTHAHPDHYGALAAVQKECDATTIAHSVDAPVIRGEHPVRYADPETLDFANKLIGRIMLPSAPPAARVDRTVEGGEVLDEVYPGAQVVHLPGHSPGQIGLYLPDERTLIGGDVMSRLPWGLYVPIKAASPDWAGVKRSIKRVAEMDVANMLVGHGPPTIGNAGAQIAKFAQRLTI